MPKKKEKPKPLGPAITDEWQATGHQTLYQAICNVSRRVAQCSLSLLGHALRSLSPPFMNERACNYTFAGGAHAFLRTLDSRARDARTPAHAAAAAHRVTASSSTFSTRATTSPT